MNLIQRGEPDPIYQRVEAANGSRHYGFLLSMIVSAIDSGQVWLSESLIKAINFHAIVGLHPDAGQYRSYQVDVGGGYSPPPFYRVQPLMEDTVNSINRSWESINAAHLAAFGMWRINQIHPFVNGNGRTARAVCYFILCAKIGGPLPGKTILTEMLRVEPGRSRYIEALKAADRNHDLSSLTALVEEFLDDQLRLDA